MSEYLTLNVYKVACAWSVFTSPAHPDQEQALYVSLDFILLVKTSTEKRSSFPVNRPGSLRAFSSLNPKLPMTLALGTCYCMYPLLC